MAARIRSSWDRVRSSFWFVPSLLTAGGVAAAIAAVGLDEVMPGDWARGWFYTSSAEAAREILGTIAGAMATTAGVVFSITLVALTLASNQLGPRLLRNFRRDRTIQLVIGTLVSTFLYCLIVLRAVRGEDSNGFIPHLSVSLGVLFALVSVGALIYFIHHIAVSIQADDVVARVLAELTKGIDRMFPEEIGKDGPGPRAEEPESLLPEGFAREARPVGAAEDGYLQLIEPGALLSLAVEEDALIRVERRPGAYLIAGEPLVRAWPADRVTEKFEARVHSAFAQGHYRTPVQDVEFSFNQLVEVAVRALSPGINDPFTAVTCLDRIGSALCRLAGRETPSPYRRDEEGVLRVIAPPDTFATIVDTAFNQIRQSARSNAAVTIRLMETISRVARFALRPQDRAALRRHAEMTLRGAQEGLPEVNDQKAVEEPYREANRVLLDPDRPPPE